MDSVDWLWIGVNNQFASWIHVRVSDLVYRTGDTIYSAEHLYETQNKITEDINEKNKLNLMLHGLSSVLKCVVQQNLLFSDRREKWNLIAWNSELTNLFGRSVLTGETENSFRLKVTFPFLLLIVSMCPEMCEFCNENALTGVSGSFLKINPGFKTQVCFDFELKFLSLPTDKTLAV